MGAAVVVVSVAFVVVALASLWFARWLVRQTGDPKSLRDAAAYLRAIPHPRVTVRLPPRRERDRPQP